MREAFSETLSAAIRQADVEARGLNQEFVGTEHLLLGIIAGSEGSAVRALKTTTDIGPLREELMKALPRGAEPPLITGRLPLSPKAQRVINTAMAGAQGAGEGTVSTRFVLLALLDEAGSTIVEALRNVGADLDPLSRLLRERPAEPER